MMSVLFYIISAIINKIMIIIIHIFFKLYFIIENILESTTGLVNEKIVNFRTIFGYEDSTLFSQISSLA